MKKLKEGVEKHCRHRNSMNESSEDGRGDVHRILVAQIFLGFTPPLSPLCWEGSSPPTRFQLHSWVFLL